MFPIRSRDGANVAWINYRSRYYTKLRLFVSALSSLLPGDVVEFYGFSNIKNNIEDQTLDSLLTAIIATLVKQTANF